jgi:GTP-binding protein SAR1
VALTELLVVVDAADRSRLPEANEELNQLLNQEALANVPFVILGNKIDIPTACSEDELRNCLGLYQQVTFGREKPSNWDKKAGGQRPVEIFMVSIMKRMGYADAFKWLSQFLD